MEWRPVTPFKPVLPLNTPPYILQLFSTLPAKIPPLIVASSFVTFPLKLPPEIVPPFLFITSTLKVPPEIVPSLFVTLPAKMPPVIVAPDRLTHFTGSALTPLLVFWG